MKRKIYTNTPSNNPSNQLPEPHHTIQQSLMEEEFSSEIAILQSHKLNPRPEAVEDLLNIINRRTLEGHC